ncbi:hypothetical protein L195_g059440 [Trifolium pratense]|uniref:Uncharacterized protein n=1 Tax=Trifolium pratense TaxID=57577 RepID=A0A2K3JUS2_TRIPR|nr:hypothetical protein L195_g058879 [Trifolium pratense]PNX58944.1 hypothetical protein L195_g059440 [Trifolium pratense]
MRGRARGFGSEDIKSEGSNEDTDYISNSVSKGSTGRSEKAKVIGSFFGGAGKERNERCDGNGVAAEEEGI